MIKGTPTPGKVYWFRRYPSTASTPPLELKPVVLIAAGTDTATVKVPYLTGLNGREIRYTRTLAEINNLFDTRREALEAAVIEYAERILNEADRIESIMRAKEAMKKMPEHPAEGEAAE